jgi:hypothetical protein
LPIFHPDQTIVAEQMAMYREQGAGNSIWGRATLGKANKLSTMLSSCNKAYVYCSKTNNKKP